MNLGEVLDEAIAHAQKAKAAAVELDNFNAAEYYKKARDVLEVLLSPDADVSSDERKFVGLKINEWKNHEKVFRDKYDAMNLAKLNNRLNKLKQGETKSQDKTQQLQERFLKMKYNIKESKLGDIPHTEKLKILQKKLENMIEDGRPIVRRAEASSGKMFASSQKQREEFELFQKAEKFYAEISTALNNPNTTSSSHVVPDSQSQNNYFYDMENLVNDMKADNSTPISMDNQKFTTEENISLINEVSSLLEEYRRAPKSEPHTEKISPEKPQSTEADEVNELMQQAMAEVKLESRPGQVKPSILGGILSLEELEARDKKLEEEFPSDKDSQYTDDSRNL